MKKFQAIISFKMDDEFMTFVPQHRTYVNFLLKRSIIESYAVSMESQTSWITFSVEKRGDVDVFLSQSPLYKYWTYTVEELFVYDSAQYKLPELQLN